MNELRIDGKPIAPKIGWNVLTPDLGGHFNSRLGWRLQPGPFGSGAKIEWPGWEVIALGARSILTLRHGSVQRAPYFYPGQGGEDFRSGGLFNISPCGDDGSVHDHDAVMQRCPVGLPDMATGKNRALASIPLPNGGYDLTRVGAQLPGIGVPTRKTPDGQHLVRAFRIGMLRLQDEFVRMDLNALLHDAALCWNRAREQEILSGPAHVGHVNVGREWANVAHLAALCGNRTMIDRMSKIARHVQTPYGNLQRSSGGNPAPPTTGNWFSDREAHESVIALKRMGCDREAAKLAAVCVGNGPKGKYIEEGTGKGDQSPTYGTAWAALGCGVYSKAQVLAIAKKWPIEKPDYMGGSFGPFADKATIREKLEFSDHIGRHRWAIETLA